VARIGELSLARPPELYLPSPPLPDLLRSAKRNGVNRLNMIPQIIHSMQLYVLTPLIFTDDELTELFSTFLFLQMVIVEVAIALWRPAVLEGSFLKRESLVANTVGTLVRMREEGAGTRLRDWLRL